VSCSKIKLSIISLIDNDVCNLKSNEFLISTHLCIVSRNAQRSIEELQRTIVDIEAKLKSEASRLKKKYETEHRELEVQIDNLGRINADLSKSNKSLSSKLKVSAFLRTLPLSPRINSVLQIFCLGKVFGLGSLYLFYRFDDDTRYSSPKQNRV
jgi:hypothetical protein